MIHRFLRHAAVPGIAMALVCNFALAQDPRRTADPSSATTSPFNQPAGPQIQPVQSPVITNVPPTIPGLPGLPQSAAKPPAVPQAEAAPDAVPERNDFQDFIATSLGQKLPLYGYDLFLRTPSTFAPVENIPVTPDYLVGPGDELLIRAWGQIDVDYRAAVDRNGTINIPRVGTIPVAGVRYQDLTSHIRTAVSRNFRNFELMVTMGQLRSVQIFVVGQARRPGAYTVSSLSTLVNAIFAAGGPSTRGSMRAIQLKRGNQVVTEFDLYDLLLKGDKSRDAPLLPGDVLYFPPIGPLAAISGGVKNPAIYEMKDAAAVATLLDYAGGLTTTAQTKRAVIERIDNRETRVVDQFVLDMGGLARTVKDGDLVSVLTISPRFENAVTLRGNVAQPLRYPYNPGMRIRDLIPEKEALVTPDYYLRRNLTTVRGDTVRQGQLSDDVRRLSNEINWDYAVIERRNEADLTTTLLPFNLGKAILDADPASNIALQPGDVVTVFSKSDVAAPSGRRPIVVRLEGEFNAAGVYQAQPGETLRQLITRAGGITPDAYLFGAEFNRESTRLNQEERLRHAVDQLEQDVQRAAVTRAQSVISTEDAASLKQETEAQRALVARLRTLKPTGRIVLEMPEQPTLANLPDMPLEDGDRLLVPRQPSMVSVFGTVFNESSFLFRPEKRMGDYLEQAGGPRKEADKRSIYVLRADGSVVSTRQSSWLWFSSLDSQRLMPGDAIVVPEDFTRTTWMKDLRDWSQIFYQFGLGAAAIKVLRD
jgi:protein involved in polysaccharide export with SLBB domain